jgi:ribosome-associated translation inhibitor RaiA
MCAMRIRISSLEPPIAEDKRAYAEYRIFTSIAPYEPHIAAVDVVVGRELTARRRFLCTVTVDLGRSGRIKTQARAMHPSAAVDRAADRTAWLIGRRVAGGFTVKSLAFTS